MNKLRIIRDRKRPNPIQRTRETPQRHCAECFFVDGWTLICTIENKILKDYSILRTKLGSIIVLLLSCSQVIRLVVEWIDTVAGCTLYWVLRRVSRVQ